MAYSIMPTIGGKFICAKPCQHRECAWNRAMIALPCRVCKKPVAQGEKYQFEQIDAGRVSRLVHAFQVCSSEFPR